MVNKKGFLKIVEAIVAILIVFGAVLTVSMSQKSQNNGDFCSSLAPLIKEIAQDNELREQIVNGDTSGTEAFLESRIKNPSINYEVKICEPGASLCPHSRSGTSEAEVCADERLISGTIDDSTAKKLKVFLFKIS